MPTAHRLLRANEELLCDLLPHPGLLLRPILLAGAVLGAEVAAFVVWASAPTWFGIVLLCVLLIDGAYLTGKLLAWRSTELIVTSSRVIYRRGVLHRVGREIPLGRVQDVSYEQHLLQRLVGIGSLRIESGGEHGAESIPDVRRPDYLQSLINDAIEASHREQLQPTVLAPTRVDNNIGELLESLNELYRNGAITRSEYEQKRAELLARM